jgi:hypothetical protein
MEGLPDQKPAARSLQLFAQHADASKLETIAGDYTKVGTVSKVARAGGDDVVLRVRSLLDLPPMALPANASEPVLLVLDNDAPRARAWAELHASALRRDGKAARVVAAADVPAGTPGERVRKLAVGGDAFPIAGFSSGAGLPLAGGPFGGTTIVVLGKGTSGADRTAWLEHEKNKVLKRRSMFANIAIAADGGEPSLRDVVTQLRGKGRSRFLIVPAAFCADAATMQALRAQLGDAAEGADVAWLPGLGAELAGAPQ